MKVQVYKFIGDKQELSEYVGYRNYSDHIGIYFEQHQLAIVIDKIENIATIIITSKEKSTPFISPEVIHTYVELINNGLIVLTEIDIPETNDKES